VRHVLKGVPGISFTIFGSKDVVRHPLVQKIVDAYAVFQNEDVSGNDIGVPESGRDRGKPEASDDKGRNAG